MAPFLRFFNAVYYHYDALLGTGDCALDSDEVVFCINLNNVEILDCNSFTAEVTSHSLTLEDTSGVDNTE